MDYKEQEFIKNYNADEYERPSATVDMLIFTIGEKEKSYRELPEKNLELLLIKRRDYPYKGAWAIPGGFVNINEHIYDAAKRELKEETNLEGIYMEQLYTWGAVNRDPRTRVISTSYMALAPKEKMGFRAGDDAADAKLFTAKLIELSKEEKKENGYVVEIDTEYLLRLENDEAGVIQARVMSRRKVLGSSVDESLEIINSDLAFDHAKIIVYAINRLRNKVEYTTVAFNLIGKVFTIGELQSVYETILDEKFTSPNFRRKILPMLEEADAETEKNRGHRPAQHYRLSKKALFGEK